LIITGSLDGQGGMHFRTGPESPQTMKRWTGHAPANGRLPSGPQSQPDVGEVLGQRPSATLVDEIEAGEVRALLVAGGNPLVALPQPARFLEAIATLDALVVVDCFDSELANHATHLLPAAWQLERSDLVLRQDRTQFSPAVVPIFSERRQAWWIFATLADRLGLSPIVDGLTSTTADDNTVLRQFEAQAGRKDDSALQAGTCGVMASIHYGWVHEQVLEEGRWRLVPEPMPRQLASAWERRCNTTRVIAGRRMNSNNSVHYAEPAAATPAIYVSADLATSHKIEDGTVVRLRSTAGEIVGTASIDHRLRSGTIWVAHGWDAPNVNMLIDSTTLNALHGQPAQSGVDVTLEIIQPSRPMLNDKNTAIAHVPARWRW
jgi:anaerobic selenocysteine-containing dehydrogenase